MSDSAFEVTNFTYTGMAPSVHWVSAMSTSPADLEWVHFFPVDLCCA